MAFPIEAIPMALLLSCTHCGSPLKVTEQTLGKKVKCPRCQATIVAQAPAGHGAAGAAASANGGFTAVPPASPALESTALVTCPACARRLKIASAHLGREVRCPFCKQPFTATGSAAPPPLPPTAISDQPVASSPGRTERRRRDDESEDEDDSRRRNRGQRRRRPSADSLPPVAFTVAVKKDPKKKLKGQFKATLTDEGLALKQGQKWDLFFPVGSEAEHTKGNAFTLDVDGRPVEFAVFTMTLYRERLAGDIVALLSGEGELQHIDDYRVPWYLYVPAALPLGIPIITLGGAIPAGLGFGLAGGCIAVAQRERWPVAARLGVMMGMVVAGYAGLFIFLIAIGSFKAAPGVNRVPVVENKPAIQQPPSPPVAVDKVPPGKVAVNAPPPGPQPKVPDAEGRIFVRPGGMGIAFLPQAPGKLVAAHAHGVLHFWDTATGLEKETLRLPPAEAGGELTAMALAPDGKKLLATRHGGEIQVLDVDRRAWQAPLEKNLPGGPSLWAVAYSPDGRFAASAHGDRLVRIWNMETQKLHKTLTDHKDQVHAIAFSPDHETLAADDGGSVRLWNFVSGVSLKTLATPGTGAPGPLPALWAIAFTPSGDTLAVGGNDGAVHLRQLADGEERAKLTLGEPISALAYDGKGKMLAAGGFKGAVRLWDAESKAELTKIDMQGQIRSIAFSPEGDPGRFDYSS